LIKRRFRKLLLRERDNIKKFKSAAENSFKVVTVGMARKFARQARSYMLVYAGRPGNSLPQKEIEKMRRQFRCHRDMGKSCIAFIESVWRWSIGMEKEDFDEKFNKKKGTKESICKEEEKTCFMDVL